MVATRYGVDDDGRYDGTIDGEFVWGTGKLAAVPAWADEHDVDLARELRLLRQLYDAPLLSAVGHPTAVNPDPRLRILATLRRWPMRWLDVPPGVPKLAGSSRSRRRAAAGPARAVPVRPLRHRGHRSHPDDGPGDHRRQPPHLLRHRRPSADACRSGASVRFLGKKEVFDAPVVGHLARAMGGIRVERGTGSDEPLKRRGRGAGGG